MTSTVFRDDCLSNRIILITGGAGAIGQAMVKLFTSLGAQVAVNDILEEHQAASVLELGERAHYFKADTTDEQQVVGLFDQVSEKLGVPNVVCCHAGIVEPYSYADCSAKDFRRVMEVNVNAAFLVAREAATRMDGRCSQQQPGRILFTSSWVQDVPWPGILPYITSKSALKQLMRGMAREVAGKHINLNAVAPGIVGVGMAKQQWENEPEYRMRASKAIPLGYLQEPESVADAYAFLASDASGYITGHTLLVDGGCSLYPMD